MINLDLYVGDSLKIGDTTITLVKKSGQLARLWLQPAPGVEVRRLHTASRDKLASDATSGIKVVR